MAEYYLVRHGKTEGNLSGRYIGTTDEPLCPEGIRALEDLRIPLPEIVYCSPMKRCRQSAELLWPEVPVTVVPDLRECDFGRFENKNYLELADDPAYQAWIDSGGTLPFPGGESMAVFKRRVLAAFDRIQEEMRQKRRRRAGLLVHGGTIMAILEQYGSPKRAYFDWQVRNGEGYLLNPEAHVTVKIEHMVD